MTTQFYGTLAEWWPVLSPVEEYAEEALELQRIIQSQRPTADTLLELGSGGGHVAHFLRPHFVCCLTDLSAEMLAVSRRLNPDCEHMQGDMRTLRLGRTFDVVLVHDAIDYMTTDADLAQVFDTAWQHLSPGGLAVFMPDTVAETFEPGADVSGGDAPDGRAARLLEWSEDLAPGATQVAVHYAFVLRERNGQVHYANERHACGVFPEATWITLLEERGFAVDVQREQTVHDHTPRRLFLAHKPTEAPV